MKRLITLVVITLSFLTSFGQSGIEGHVRTLASDQFSGRKGGTDGDTLTINYILDQLSTINGVRLWGTDGQQRFNVAPKTLHSLPESGNSMSISGKVLTLDKDFFPTVFSASGEFVSQDVVFGGYGLNINSGGVCRNDYQNIDVNGKWVLLLRESPDPSNDHYHSPSWDFAKVEEARKQGASGVLLVHGKGDRWQLLESTELWTPQSDLPVICITREVANLILSDSNSIEELEKRCRKSVLESTLECSSGISANLRITRKVHTTSNIIATIDGQNQRLKDEVILVGAHFDHWGITKRDGQLMVMNGADDNASGVSMVLDLARKVSLGKRPDRTIMFVFFGAEEEGLVGSKYFTYALPLEQGRVVHMVNLDMLGRYSTYGSIDFYGLDSYAEGLNYASKLPNPDKLRIKTVRGMGVTSDHIPFNCYNISVSGFNTGTHKQVHTPFDDVDLIDFSSMPAIADYVYNYLVKLASRSSNITFAGRIN